MATHGLPSDFRAHSKKRVDTAYEIASTGFIWIFDKKKKMGFARLFEPEWGFIDETEIVGAQLLLARRPVRILEEHLPCTFGQLIERCPQLRTYFATNGVNI